MKLEGTFLEHFKNLDDPRLSTHRNFRHNLGDIFVITILATICGADNWMEIERFGLAKQTWLETFSELPHGVPSHDTFARVFALLEPNRFETCFNQWMASLPILLAMLDVQGAIVTIDAMGCQTDIAKQIIHQGADYVLSLKENQPTLYQDVSAIFLRAEESEKKYKKMLHLRTVEKVHKHGRVETRRYTLISARDPLLFELRCPGRVSGIQLIIWLSLDG